MNILVFLNALGLGGTEKAACCWAKSLHDSGRHQVSALSLQNGPRRKFLETAGIEVRIAESCPSAIQAHLNTLKPDVIHAHCPGYPHEGDILGSVLHSLGRKIPVVQTNIFGKLENSRENAWTDFRLFISWTSCVQAARRSRRNLNPNFFRRQSVAAYPVDPVPDEKLEQLRAASRRLREQLGVPDDHILFGRFSRPEPNKWTDLPLQGFLLALKKNPKIKLLLREPPPLVAAGIQKSKLDSHVLILPATADADELQISQMACDAILHGSSIGESFGYGIAEPMALGKPVIAHSVPWNDQAQVELIRHGECGYLASTPGATARAILRLAGDAVLRASLGANARRHIGAVADPQRSLESLETALACAAEGRANPRAMEDCAAAREAADYLDRNQWGHTLGEYAHLKAKSFSISALRQMKIFRSTHPLLLYFFEAQSLF
jgi:glycosyltransferase involved in cell wall biosynthesis